MATMLNVYDRLTRKKTAVLQNAYNIVETHELNQIYTLSFTLPAIDEKNKFCLPRHFVRWGDDGELYRIKEPQVNDSDVGTITYQCEHAITTLCDSVMFGSFIYGGASVKTSATITWLLSQQKSQDWVLGECDFDRNFEYNWEQENILNALYSVPKEFAQPYKWVFDTTVYPWRISLKAIDPTVKPEYYLRARSNILASGTSADYANICTRIYPLGYGEGVNQLNIRSVNNNVPYLQSPAEIVAQYGIVEKVLVDRRFENAETLKAYAQSMLDVYQTPSMSRSFDVTDLYPLTSQSWDDAEVGKICRMAQDNTTAYITKCKWQRDKAGDLQIDLSTKATDIASNVADLADRVRIESVYAQGATQLYQHSKDANATPEKGMILSLYFPSEMKQINKVLLRLKLNRFRSYSSTTENGGGTTSSSGGTSVTVSGGGSSGNGTDQMTSGLSMNVSVSGTVSAPKATQTSAPSTDVTSGTVWSNQSAYAGPQTGTAYLTVGGDKANISISDGGGGTQTVEQTSSYTSTPLPYGIADDSHYHSLPHQHSLPSHSHSISQSNHKHPLYNEQGDQITSHSHTIYLRSLAHSHNINHYHTVTVSGGATGGQHTHTFNIPNHTHTITAHNHKITPGIFESGNPTAFDIYVGNTKKATVNATSYDGDITQWLLNNKNQIPRGQWIDVEFRPNDIAYVVSSVFVQGFVQSRGGGNY